MDADTAGLLNVIPAESTAKALRTCKIRFWDTARWQILLTSLIGFSCPGMLNALNGMGGGGNVDPTIATYASSALMASSAVSYIVICAPLFEILGVRSMSAGCWAYALYPLALLMYASNGSDGWLVVVSGLFLGIGSALFWLVQGAIMISYPLPHQKGTAFAFFWIVFNLGGMVGALIAVAQNQGEDEEGTVSKGTYVAFAAIMLVGQALTFTLRPPERVTRDVMSVVGLLSPSRKSLKTFPAVIKREIQSLLDIRHEKRVVWLIPMFFAANWSYSYQQNIMNGFSFDLAGRSFNSALYWAAQIMGGLAIPLLCDLPLYPTRIRALIAWTTLCIFGNLTMLYGYRFELVREQEPQGWIKFREEGYGPAAALYFAYGMLDALWQGRCYWLLGISCSTPQAAGKLVAVYKVAQAIGASIAYAMTMKGVSGYVQFLSNWVMVAGTLVVALPAVLGVEGAEPPTHEIQGYTAVPSDAHGS